MKKGRKPFISTKLKKKKAYNIFRVKQRRNPKYYIQRKVVDKQRLWMVVT